MKTTQDFIKHNIECLDSKYSNAIPVFGGALWVYHDNNFSSERFISGLSHVAENAKFFKWHEGVVGAMRRYCHLCMVDPVVVEAELGMKFEELCVQA